MAIEIRGMAPLLQVFDMPASIVFYRDVLGFQVKSTSSPGKERFDWALLTLNGVELMLNTAYEEWSPISCERHQTRHLDFCYYRLLTEGLLVRI
jgi:glyoxylase I family protein